jgi:aspartate-semialdehyde dehydrogenase
MFVFQPAQLLYLLPDFSYIDKPIEYTIMKNCIHKKIPVGILGATGTVGQKLILLLENHPWFQIVCVAASSRSKDKPYEDAVENRWSQDIPIPSPVKNSTVYDVERDRKTIAGQIVFAFSALSTTKEKVRKIEGEYAEAGIPIISCNSAHRWTEDVPMIIPEVNPHHSDLIYIQRKNNNWKKGFIVVKPNCSIQSYVPVLDAWKIFTPLKVIVSTYQAISGAGKTFESWPEMKDNVIPFIPGQEEKSEMEPLKIWGRIDKQRFRPATIPKISSTCIRIPVTDGHMVSVSVEFKKKPSRQDLIEAIHHFQNPIQDLHLPSDPGTFLKYYDQDDRPQTSSERWLGKGMSIAVGRLREDPILHWKFVALSHNTIRGAAGGAILTAELLAKKGFIQP